MIRTKGISLMAAAVALSFTALRGEDCNGNGVDDRRDVRPQGFDYPSAGRPSPGSQPLRVLAVDVDGDQDLDLIMANKGMGDISVLLDEGGAKFGRPRSFAAGVFATDMAASDLDGDGDVDLAAVNGLSSNLTLLENDTEPAFSRDEDGDGGPDECQRTVFHRGDPDGDGSANIGDGISILSRLFQSGVPFACDESADTDNDGSIAITDAIFLLQFLFLGGASPPEPGPPGNDCGFDPDPPGSARDIGCASYQRCVP